MLQGIMGLAGVLGGIGRSNGAGRTMGKGMGYLTDAQANALKQYRERDMWFKDNKAKGLYNPQEAYDWANNESARNTKVGSSNIAAQLGGMGYRNGDSNAPQAQRQFSDQQKNALSKMLLDIQNSYHQKQSNDMGYVENAGRNYQGVSSQIGRDIYGIGQQQQQQSGLGSSLASLAGLNFDFLKPRGGSPGVTQGQTQQPGGPGGIAGWNWGQLHF